MMTDTNEVFSYDDSDQYTLFPGSPGAVSSPLPPLPDSRVHRRPQAPVFEVSPISTPTYTPPVRYQKTSLWTEYRPITQCDLAGYGIVAVKTAISGPAHTMSPGVVIVRRILPRVELAGLVDKGHQNLEFVNSMLEIAGSSHVYATCEVLDISLSDVIAAPVSFNEELTSYICGEMIKGLYFLKGLGYHYQDLNTAQVLLSKSGDIKLGNILGSVVAIGASEDNIGLGITAVAMMQKGIVDVEDGEPLINDRERWSGLGIKFIESTAKSKLEELSKDSFITNVSAPDVLTSSTNFFQPFLSPSERCRSLLSGYAVLGTFCAKRYWEKVGEDERPDSLF